MYYILHKKGEELTKDNIEKVLRFKKMNNDNITFNGYCLNHKIPENYENMVTKVLENDITTTLKINDNIIKLVIWEWDIILTFRLDFSYEFSEYEIFDKIV